MVQRTVPVAKAMTSGRFARFLRHERLTLARKPGGRRATYFWLLGRLRRCEFYDLLAVPVHADASPASIPHGFGMHRIATPRDCDDAGPTLVAELSKQSGPGVGAVISNGGRVYVLTFDGQVATQLNIQMSPHVSIDTPLPMSLGMSEGDCFLSFLFTHPAYRGRRLAQALIVAAMRDVAAEGKSRMITHVSATNVNSQNAFLSLGWRRAGQLVVRDGSVVDRSGLSALQLDCSMA